MAATASVDKRIRNFVEAYVDVQLAYIDAERRVAEVEELNAGLSDLVAELLPYSGDTCPGECRYRAECKLPSNQSSTGEPLTCVAYGHLLEKARELGVEVKR